MSELHFPKETKMNDLMSLNLVAIEDSRCGVYKKGQRFISRGLNKYGWDVVGTDITPAIKSVKLIIDQSFLGAFRDKKIAVNCETQEEAREFCDILTAANYNWRAASPDYKWDTYTDRTCYVYVNRINNGYDREFSPVRFYKGQDYTILKYSNLIKEETAKMTQEYKVVKPFNLDDLSKVNPCHEEFIKLLTECVNSNRSFNQHFNTWNSMKQFDTFVNNTGWLVDTGFIEKVKTFQPFTLELKIEKEDDLLNLWHRTNAANIGTQYNYKYQPQPEPKKKFIGQKLWRQIDKQMCRLNGVIPKDEIKGLWDPQI